MLRYFAKCTKRVSVTEPKESDVPDKRQRDGIGGEASVTVAVVDSQRTMLRPQFGATLSASGVVDFSTSL